MSPIEAGVLVLGVVLGLALFATVMVALASLIRTLGSARKAIDELTSRAIPMLDEAHEVVRLARKDMDKVDTLLTRADSISGTVDSASKLAYSLFSNPAVKALALASGGARAVARLGRNRTGSVRRLGRGRSLRKASAVLAPGADSPS